MSTFVSVGNANQPFRRLLDEISRIARDLPQPVIVQHGNTPFRTEGCQAMPFVEMDEFEHLVEKADLLIIHAGAGSVIHAAHAGKVPVVIPRRQELGEHVDNHQLEFVQELEKTGRIVAVYDCELLLQAIADAQTRQSEMQRKPTQSRVVHLVQDLLTKYAQSLNP